MSIRKAINIGSSVGITIPARFLRSRNISAGDDLSVEETAAGIMIRPAKTLSKRSDKITALTLDFVNRYREDLEALA